MEIARGVEGVKFHPLSDPGVPTFDPNYQILQPFIINIQ